MAEICIMAKMNFKFFHIPVRIEPTYWLFVLLFVNITHGISVQSFILALVLTISLLVHEYGHAITALLFGARPTITLELLGGRSQYNSFGMTTKQLFLITLMGPLLESLLIVFSYSLLKLHVFENGYVHFFLVAMFRVNLFWCLLNLIPIIPMDGGYLLRYLLEGWMGEKGVKTSLWIGLISAAAIAPILLLGNHLFFGALLLVYAYHNFQQLKQIRLPSREEGHFSTYLRGLEAVKENDLTKAKILLKKLLKVKDEKMKNSATESLAKIYLQEKHPEKSYKLLLDANPTLLKEGKFLLCQLAFERQNYTLVTEHSDALYAEYPSMETALLNSKAYAYLQQPELAGGWLKTASQFGTLSKESIAELVKQQPYDSLKNKKAFHQYLEN